MAGQRIHTEAARLWQVSVSVYFPSQQATWQLSPLPAASRLGATSPPIPHPPNTRMPGARCPSAPLSVGARADERGTPQLWLLLLVLLRIVHPAADDHPPACRLLIDSCCGRCVCRCVY